MDRQATRPGRGNAKAVVAGRLRQIRLEQYGEHGIQVIASKLGVPFGTWSNYERGVTIPGEILLEFIEVTGIDALWLLRGLGEKYRVATV